jgi:hypothetical protein
VLRNGLTVIKFGSSVLRGETDLPVVVEQIARWLGSEQNVLAVVSAFGNTTDELFRKARSFGDQTNQEAVARLVGTGEEASAALLALALALHPAVQQIAPYREVEICRSLAPSQYTISWYRPLVPKYFGESAGGVISPHVTKACQLPSYNLLNASYMHHSDSLGSS